eukprot:81502-Pyramimonas_sp.AAC.1
MQGPLRQAAGPVSVRGGCVRPTRRAVLPSCFSDQARGGPDVLPRACEHGRALGRGGAGGQDRRR